MTAYYNTTEYLAARLTGNLEAALRRGDAATAAIMAAKLAEVTGRA